MQSGPCESKLLMVIFLFVIVIVIVLIFGTLSLDSHRLTGSSDGKALHFMQTPEGYISKDIYIISCIQKAPKWIFPIIFWSRIF
jgi:hypothetical protein